MNFIDIPIFAINAINVFHIIIFILEKLKISLDMLLNFEVIAIRVRISCENICEVFFEFLRQHGLIVLDVGGPPLSTQDLRQLDDVV